VRVDGSPLNKPPRNPRTTIPKHFPRQPQRKMNHPMCGFRQQMYLHFRRPTPTLNQLKRVIPERIQFRSKHQRWGKTGEVTVQR